MIWCFAEDRRRRVIYCVNTDGVFTQYDMENPVPDYYVLPAYYRWDPLRSPPPNLRNIFTHRSTIATIPAESLERILGAVARGDIPPGISNSEIAITRLNQLPVLSNEVDPLRPLFSQVYETFDEINIRLVDTVVHIFGAPYLIESAYSGPPNILCLRGADNSRYYVHYEEVAEHMDCRSFKPGYYYRNRCGAFFVTRQPARLYKQGMCRQNAYARYAGGSPFRLTNIESFLSSFVKTPPTPWQESLLKDLQDNEYHSVRLSDDVSVYLHGVKQVVTAEFKGRILGNINDNAVTFRNETDMEMPWIRDSLRQVNLTPRKAA